MTTRPPVCRHSAYKDYVSHVVDPRSDPITRGLGDYVVTDELYHPHVFDPARTTRGAAPSFYTAACFPYRDSPWRVITDIQAFIIIFFTVSWRLREVISACISSPSRLLFHTSVYYFLTVS